MLGCRSRDSARCRATPCGGTAHSLRRRTLPLTQVPDALFRLPAVQRPRIQWWRPCSAAAAYSVTCRYCRTASSSGYSASCWIRFAWLPPKTVIPQRGRKMCARLNLFANDTCLDHRIRRTFVEQERAVRRRARHDLVVAHLSYTSQAVAPPFRPTTIASRRQSQLRSALSARVGRCGTLRSRAPARAPIRKPHLNTAISAHSKVGSPRRAEVGSRLSHSDPADGRSPVERDGWLSPNGGSRACKTSCGGSGWASSCSMTVRSTSMSNGLARLARTS